MRRERIKSMLGVNFGYLSKLEYIPYILPLCTIAIDIEEKDNCREEVMEALRCEHFFNGMVV